MVLMDVLDQIELCLCRAHHQDLLRALQQSGDVLEIGVIFLRVARTYASALVMLMGTRIG